MHILLVEDEPELSQLAAETMETMGHRVTVATGVEEAMRHLDDPSLDLDLMIADHRLPDGWGVALCVQCKVKHPRLKTCVVSGCLNTENIQLLDEFKIPYWQKPILYSTVLRKMMTPPVPEVRPDNVLSFEKESSPHGSARGSINNG
jgi:DNA-binding response OmpR family regulator